MHDLDAVARIIDSAAAEGANTISYIQCTVWDLRPLHAAERGSANARASAEAMAGGLGMRLGRLVSVERAEAPPARPLQQAVYRATAAETPIEPGTVEAHASVTVTYEVGQ